MKTEKKLLKLVIFALSFSCEASEEWWLEQALDLYFKRTELKPKLKRGVAKLQPTKLVAAFYDQYNSSAALTARSIPSQNTLSVRGLQGDWTSPETRNEERLLLFQLLHFVAKR